MGSLTLQIHLFSFREHLIAPAASRTAGVVVLISCLQTQSMPNRRDITGKMKINGACSNFQEINRLLCLFSAARTVTVNCGFIRCSTLKMGCWMMMNSFAILQPYPPLGRWFCSYWMWPPRQLPVWHSQPAFIDLSVPPAQCNPVKWSDS